jgi:hypothetical protein
VGLHSPASVSSERNKRTHIGAWRRKSHVCQLVPSASPGRSLALVIANPELQSSVAYGACQAKCDESRNIRFSLVQAGFANRGRGLQVRDGCLTVLGESRREEPPSVQKLLSTLRNGLTCGNSPLVRGFSHIACSPFRKGGRMALAYSQNSRGLRHDLESHLRAVAELAAQFGENSALQTSATGPVCGMTSVKSRRAFGACFAMRDSSHERHPAEEMQGQTEQAEAARGCAPSLGVRKRFKRRLCATWQHAGQAG